MKCQNFSGFACLLTTLALICSSDTTAQIADSTDRLAQHREQRAKAAHRKRRIIFNNAGDDHLLRGPTSLGAFLAQRTTPLLGSQVDTIFYCTSRPFGMFTHNTKVGDVLTTKTGFRSKRNNLVADLIGQGTDPLRAMVDFCHTHGTEVFWSMRMNDTHDTSHSPKTPHYYFSTFKKEHPEVLLGTRSKRPAYGSWPAVDYGESIVRDFALRIFREICREYDVDGIELDFFRHLVFFRSVANGGQATSEERDLMTQLMRCVREMTEAEGLRRGRPILIATRAPDSVECCRGMGLDVEKWMADGLIDLFIAGGDFRLNPWDYSTSLGRKYDVPVYCDLDPSIPYNLCKSLDRNSIQAYRARATNAWQAGAAGIYIFNCFNPRHPLWRELGDAEKLRRTDKLYFGNVTGRSGYLWAERILRGGADYANLPSLHPRTPMRLLPGKPVEVVMQVGEDTSGATSEGLPAKVTCHVLASVAGLPQLSLNAVPLAGRRREGNWFEFPVRAKLVRQGANRFEVSIGQDYNAASPWDVEYVCDDRPPVPWTPGRRTAGTSAKMQDGALLIADRSTERGSYLYRSYPWNVDPASQAVFEAKVKVVSGRSTVIVTNGVSEEEVRLFPDRVAAYHAGLSHALTTTNAYHLYRIEILGQDIKVFVDDALRLDGVGKFTYPAHSSRNLICFGASSSSTTGEAYWELVRFRSGIRSLYDITLSVSYSPTGERRP